MSNTQTAATKTEKTATKTAATKTAAKPQVIKLAPEYKKYLSAFNAEVKSATKTSIILNELYSHNMTASAYYKALFAEGYKAPKEWPTKKDGALLSASSTAVRQAIPAVNRLVSAFDMRKKREKDATKALETAKEPEVQIIPEQSELEVKQTEALITESPANESAPRVETANTPSFDAVLLIESLQGFMVEIAQGRLELDDKDAKLAHKLSKQLIDLAQKA